MYKKYYFNFKKINDKYLLTNDFGFHTFLSKNDFNKLINNKPLPKHTMIDLEQNKFIYFESDEEFVRFNKDKIKEFKNYLDSSTVLHIFVVSKNCNYNCIYCQAGELNQKEDMLMSEEIAKKAVDIAFESPSECLDFEFQGGEPLTNFKIIKFIVEYSKEKNSLIENEKQKHINYNIVSNLSLLTDEMIKYIDENNIFVCTSIDGNSRLQNINRPYKNDSYNSTINSLKKLCEKNINASALLTTTKYSLEEYKSIVDEYIKLGQDRICVRPLTHIGKASKNWDEISYEAEDFITFYKNILDYIIEKNKEGNFIIEGMASILLSKIINVESPNYMELRSPCGGAIGQMAYYYDGNIYSCDEGRMLAEMGDKKFYLGNVFESTYKDLLNNDCVKEICNSSTLESSSICHSCAYMPYCGICPVLNYSLTGKMELRSKNDYRCKINSGILDILFSYIEKDRNVLKIFKSWL